MTLKEKIEKVVANLNKDISYYQQEAKYASDKENRATYKTYVTAYRHVVIDLQQILNKEEGEP